MRFGRLVAVFQELERTSARNEMVEILGKLLSEASPSEARMIAYLLHGDLGPSFRKIKMNMADKLAEEAVASALGIGKEKVAAGYKRSGDLGTAAADLKKEGKAALDLEEVFKKLLAVAEAGGGGSQERKIELMAGLLKKASPLEAKYIVRIVLGKLRMGVGDYTFLDALSFAKKGSKEFRKELERAYNLSSDLGAVAFDYLGRGGAREVRGAGVSLFSPVRPALAERLSSAKEIVGKIGKCAIEPKYDGFRVQVHKKGKEVRLYSRNLEETTKMFPEIVEGAREQVDAGEAIFEGEALAYDEDAGAFYPFQETAKRKRKHGVKEMREELPLRLFAFDLLYKDGKNFMDEQYGERKAELRRMIKKGKTIAVAQEKITGDAEEIERIFEGYVSEGLEGVVAKDLKSKYAAGARKFAWIKLKRSYRSKLSDTVDVVIVGYLKGKGKRAELGIGALLGAVYNKKRDMFETIAKIGSGMTEEQTRGMKKVLDKLAAKNKPARVDSKLVPDVWVAPSVVVEVNADEITKSPMHTCALEKGVGLSLRFPRVIGFIRKDKGAEDATTTQEVLEMFKKARR